MSKFSLNIINQQFTLPGNKLETITNIIYFDFATNPNVKAQQVNFQLSYTEGKLKIRSNPEPVFTFRFAPMTLRLEDTKLFCGWLAEALDEAFSKGLGITIKNWAVRASTTRGSSSFSCIYDGSEIEIPGTLNIIAKGLIAGGAWEREENLSVLIDNTFEGPGKGSKLASETVIGGVFIRTKPIKLTAPMVWGSQSYLMDGVNNHFTVFFRKFDGEQFEFGNDTKIDFYFPVWNRQTHKPEELLDANWAPTDAFGTAEDLKSIKCGYVAGQLPAGTTDELIAATIPVINPAGSSYGGFKKFSVQLRAGISGMGVFHFSDVKLSGGNSEAVLHIHVSNLPGYVDSTYDVRFIKSALYVTAGDRVGVGTTNPAARFHVRGAAMVEGTSTLMGKVGIGTINPSSSLHVLATNEVGRFEGKTDNAKLLLMTSEGDKKAVAVCNRAGGKLALWAGADVLTVTSEQNVGIGTSTPDAKLQVDGRIKDQTGFIMPVGSIIAYGGRGLPPMGWLLCDGSPLDQSMELANVLGRPFTPDLRSRFIVGAGQGPTINEVVFSNYEVNAIGGEENHKLTINEMPPHDHDVRAHGHFQTPNAGNEHNVMSPSGLDTGYKSSSTGGNSPHENRPPYYALTYIIKY